MEEIVKNKLLELNTRFSEIKYADTKDAEVEKVQLLFAIKTLMEIQLEYYKS